MEYLTGSGERGLTMAKRRGNGEGTISKRADGRWWARLDLGWENGKRQRKAYYGATRREVQDKLDHARHDRKLGLPIADERITVAQYLDRWLDAVRAKLRASSYSAYELNVRRAKPLIGQIRLAHLSSRDLQQLYSRLLQTGLSGRPLSRRSVEQCHTVLHKALHQAVGWNNIGRNPADHVEVPRPVHNEMKTLSQEEVETLLISSAGDRLHGLWALLVTTGLRLGEGLALRWQDLDWSATTLNIQRALQRERGTGRLVYVEPKSKQSRRTVHLTGQVLAILREHRKLQAERRLAAGPAWADGGLVFATDLGEPLNPLKIGSYLDSALKQAGLPRIRVHDLRHTAATLLLQWGTHPKVVQEMLGHSTIAITLDLYSHVIPAMHRDAAHQFGRLFSAGERSSQASS